MIPTSIDGTDITGATIDGTDVTEITVDGTTVFTSAPTNLPVGYSNLVAWYPFDSATYGGSNADDVTAIIGGSGDDTAYDGTVSGAIYQSSSGVTDINAGANSGAYDFDGNGDEIDLPNPVNFDETFCAGGWAFSRQNGVGNVFFVNFDMTLAIDTNTPELQWSLFDGSTSPYLSGGTPNVNQWHHCVVNRSKTSGMELYFDGSVVDSNNFTGDPQNTVTDWVIGLRSNIEDMDGFIDDFRIYNRTLSSSEILQWYNNTQP